MTCIEHVLTHLTQQICPQVGLNCGCNSTFAFVVILQQSVDVNHFNCVRAKETKAIGEVEKRGRDM